MAEHTATAKDNKITATLKNQVRDFTPLESAAVISQSADRVGTPNKPTARDFVSLQIRDYSWRVTSRKTYGRLLLGLLIAQNIVVFTIVIIAMFTGKLQELQLVFAVLVSATLGETAYMVKVIIEWLFKEINYPLSEQRG